MATSPQKPVVIRFGKFKWVAAAFIFGLIGGMCFMAPMGSKGLFESNFLAQEDDMSQSIDMGLSTRGSNTPQETIDALKKVRQGFDHYNDKQYKEAIKLFEEHLAYSADKYDAKGIKFYLGVSYLAEKQTAAAQKVFEELTQLEKFNRKEDSKWYLALTYIQAQNKTAAKSILTELSQSNKYKTQAQEMLAKADQSDAPKKERLLYFR